MKKNQKEEHFKSQQDQPNKALLRKNSYYSNESNAEKLKICNGKLTEDDINKIRNGP